MKSTLLNLTIHSSLTLLAIISSSAFADDFCAGSVKESGTENRLGLTCVSPPVPSEANDPCSTLSFKMMKQIIHT